MLTQDELAMLQAIRASGSLSRAAAQLGKAPSTISHAARQLETRYDALLFDRRRYRLELTPAGKLLAEEAERLLTESGGLLNAALERGRAAPAGNKVAAL